MTEQMIEQEGFVATVAMAARPERVFEALTTLDGLAGWWTPAVGGTPTAGGEITFRFGDQAIVMRVAHVDPPASVVWTCVSHSKFPEWRDSTLRFDLRPHGDEHTWLAFQHVGLAPRLECYSQCEAGWHHYLASLAADVAGNGGSPWGTPTWRPAPRPQT
jgi:uncharacterized protein YndB with AHSA1/START domain